MSVSFLLAFPTCLIFEASVLWKLVCFTYHVFLSLSAQVVVFSKGNTNRPSDLTLLDPSTNALQITKVDP